MAYDQPLTEEQQAAKYPNSDLARAIAAEKAATAPKPGTTAPKPSTTVPVMGSGLPSALPVIPKGPEIPTTSAPFGQGRTMNFAGAGATPRFAGSAQSTQQSTQPGFAGLKPDTFASDREKAKLQEIDAKKWNPEGKSFLQKFGHGLATAGNIAGDIFAPQTMALIPGTQLHSAIEERRAEDAYEKARAQEEKPELAAAQGELKGELEASKEAAREKGIQETLGSREKVAGENNATRTDIAGKNNATRKEVTGENNTTKEDIAGENIASREKIASGAQAIKKEGQAATAAAKADPNWKPHVTSDEKKKAELSDNIKENAIYVKGILAHRPDIVGAIAGRFTTAEQMIGSNDPDVAALGTRIHNIAMASAGVHGLRSQQAVEHIEKILLNQFKNGPAAINGALDATTGSVQTFINEARPEGYGQKQQGGGEKKQGNEKDPLGILQ